MHHILGNKVLEYDVDDRGVIVDEEISSYLYDSNELNEILNSEVWTEMN